MKMNIKNLHDQFCDEATVIKNYRKTTIRSYRSTIDYFLRESGIETIDAINTEKLREFLYNGRIKRNWTADTFLHYYKDLRAFLKWCVQYKFLAENPILPIEKPKLNKKLPKRITKQEAEKILECASYRKYRYHFERYRNRAIFAIMIYAGLRASEMLNLKVDEVDLQNRIISINQGKGGKDRIVPICTGLFKILFEYLKDRERLDRKCMYFFTSIGGDRSFTYNGLKKVIDILKAETGIKFSSHRLRHTFATLMLEGGCDLFSLQKMMGHSDIKTTTIYLSATISHLQEQIRKHPLE